MSLIETKRGRPTGHRALDAQREEIIEKAIRTYNLKPTRPTVWVPAFDTEAAFA